MELKSAETSKEENKKQAVADGDNKDKDKDDPDAKLKESLMSCVITEKPNVKWSDVAGLEKAKESLQEAVILPLKFPHLFTGKRKPWKGILLYGPPGTGKSYLAKACATEAKGTFYSVSASNLVTKWMGESERLVKNLFKLARETKPAIIFIDEIDSMVSARTDGEAEATRRIKTEFLVQMDGVGNDDDGLLVLGATNIPWGIDPAARRRFQRKIYISLPDEVARLHMFKLNVGKTPNNLVDDDYKKLAEISEGYSGSDIAVLTQDAIFEPVRKCSSAKYFRKNEEFYVPCAPSDSGAMKMSMHEIPEPELLKPNDVSVDDFLKAISNIKPTVSEADLIRQDEFTKDFGSEG